MCGICILGQNTIVNNLFDLPRIIKFQMNKLIIKSLQEDSNNLISQLAWTLNQIYNLFSDNKFIS